MNSLQLRELVIRPVLIHMGMYSEAAEQLVLGTAIQESRLHWIRQLHAGPARGIYQMEPKTHDDIWLNFLTYRPALVEKVSALELPDWHEGHDADEMEGNLYYATAMCRLQYYRRPEPLPAPGNITAMGEYWKKYYNTSKGKGTVTEYIHNWHKFC